MTHWMPARSASRSAYMAGWATVTMVPSSETIIAPTDRVTSVSQGWPARRAAGGRRRLPVGRGRPVGAAHAGSPSAAATGSSRGPGRPRRGRWCPRRASSRAGRRRGRACAAGCGPCARHGSCCRTRAPGSSRWRRSPAAWSGRRWGAGPRAGRCRRRGPTGSGCCRSSCPGTPGHCRGGPGGARGHEDVLDPARQLPDLLGVREQAVHEVHRVHGEDQRRVDT